MVKYLSFHNSSFALRYFFMYEQHSIDGSSTISTDGLASEQMLGDGDISFRHTHGEDVASSSDGSSPLGWPLGRTDRPSGEPSPSSSELNRSRDLFMWEEKREKRQTVLSEVELMKERFAKLLLGDDMSGGAKGVCTALAISNAITNLSASLFGELWRLEPLAEDRRTRWRREMEWLLSVSDHIVELVPSWQTFPDGTNLEVMVSRPRSDLHINLPALRKLDTMLVDSLDRYTETEFWYVDRGIVMAEKDNQGGPKLSLQRQEEKWWLPTPKVPVNGLSVEARRQLQHQRECTSQILKAAMSINGQVLSEMEVPQIYLDSLPKSGKASLGESLYKGLSSEKFSAAQFLSTLDLSNEHSKLEIADRLETALLVWHQKIQTKQLNPASKSSWGMMKDFVADENKREQVADRAESLLLCLKQRFPGLTQTALDMNKIQYNRDVGQSILESYSRVLESLASTIIARIDDILYADNLVTMSAVPTAPTSGKSGIPHSKRNHGSYTVQLPAVGTPHTTTPFVSPNTSPTPNSNMNSNSVHDVTQGTVLIQGPHLTQVFSDFLSSEKLEMEMKKEQEDLVKIPPDATNTWSYAGELENSNALHSPPSRD
ncbi:unnamed protein product [Sphagnum jensenii]|uniref:PRONE domain-containing protein n=1 Tax=Sphagnum jensenii TaxID=128206 RepID=A0ABP0WQW4_9BRYO